MWELTTPPAQAPIEGDWYAICFGLRLPCLPASLVKFEKGGAIEAEACDETAVSVLGKVLAVPRPQLQELKSQIAAVSPLFSEALRHAKWSSNHYAYYVQCDVEPLGPELGRTTGLYRVSDGKLLPCGSDFRQEAGLVFVRKDSFEEYFADLMGRAKPEADRKRRRRGR